MLLHVILVWLMIDSGITFYFSVNHSIPENPFTLIVAICLTFFSFLLTLARS